MKSYLTAPSRANLIPLNRQLAASPPAKPEDKLTFAQARDAWLARWQEQDQLTHADRALVTQVYRHFNRVHFEKTGGELLAWPAWKTIAARARLSKSSVFRGFRKLERLGALEIKHGRYNHQTKRRAGNIYRAIDQGFILRPTKVSNRDRPRFQDETRLFDSDSLNKNDSLNLKKEEQQERKVGFPREASKQKGNEDFPPSLSLPSSSLMNSAAAPEEVPRVARFRWRTSEEGRQRAQAALDRCLADNGGGHQ
jgi:hypothetical protein